jgi:hypothetical protein
VDNTKGVLPQPRFGVKHTAALFAHLHNGLRKQKARAKNRLVAVEVAGSDQWQEPEGGYELALVWAGGGRLEVHRGFDEATLERSLNVLERR